MAGKATAPGPRFWSKIALAGPDECWEWQGARNEQGYGTFFPEHELATKAHRFAYRMLVGPIPNGMCVLHRCDNPPCVNPRHLFLGTKRDNTLDMWAKGRGWQARLPGESNGRALLSLAQVREIRALHPGVSQLQLAARFGVSPQTIGRIVRHETWKEAVPA